MDIAIETIESIRSAIQPDRLLDTALKLIEVPSPTRQAKGALDRMDEILSDDGFTVERHDADWPDAPAVVVRWSSGRPGKTIQFAGHLDTVHLQFVPPRVESGLLYGSGASDMKGGTAAAVEALRVLRDLNALQAGDVLFTAFDLHEAPWGDGAQITALTRDGIVGDGVLIPEYHMQSLPVGGRGLAIMEVTINRDGEPMHEVVGGIEQPNVIAAGVELVQKFLQLDKELAEISDPMIGRESAFVGQIHSGEIFNQSPTELTLSGTRRWIPGTKIEFVEQQYRSIINEIAQTDGIQIEDNLMVVVDAFELDQSHPLIDKFQSVCQAVMGKPLPVGPKPFADDGNRISTIAGVPAITHGPDAKGAHTLEESVPVKELQRVALVYALTAMVFCPD